MHHLDSYRAANLLIQQHGKDAKVHAVRRLQDMQGVGDEAGAWAWLSIFDAVLTLEATQPAEGQSTH